MPFEAALYNGVCYSAIRLQIMDPAAATWRQPFM